MGERSEQERIRLEKLRRLKEAGFDFPNDVGPLEPSSSVMTEPVCEELEHARRFTLAGRLVQIREMGKAAFAHILDGAGKIQIYFKRDVLGEAAFKQFKELDLGDIISVRGYAFVTKTGEKSLFAESFRLLTKALIPLPEKWHGLTDVEARYRQRYVDLIANPEVRELFRTRARIIQELRAFFDQRGFLEVETPVLHYLAGGASARPFKTHYNALDTEMYLRIALELPLKKLVVGGFERVYEIGHNFRNEGLSRKHSPEFTMLEFYQAYATFEDLMVLTEELFAHLARRICGSTKISFGGHEIELEPPWPRVSMQEALYEYGGVERGFDLSSAAGVRQAAARYQVNLPPEDDWGYLLEELWGELAEKNMLQPCFLTQHPFSISPLARRCSANPQVVDRFEVIIAGLEMANAFSELNDAMEQRQRFEEQARRKAAGDEEACEVDEDFLRALEYGLPPTAGEGIGIDRLVMLFTGAATIREVILFPQLKPDGQEGGGGD